MQINTHLNHLFLNVAKIKERVLEFRRKRTKELGWFDSCSVDSFNVVVEWTLN